METEGQQTLQNSQSMVHEVKLAEGIYFTDFRKGNVGANKCQSSLVRNNQDFLPKHPELLIALFKENDNKISKLLYSINEIKKVDNYKEDYDFVLAIKEDYDVILKTLEYEVKLLEELEKLDCYNPLLKKHSVEGVQELIRQYTLEQNDFRNEMEAGKENNKIVGNVQNVPNEQKPDANDDKNSVFI